MFLLQAGKKGDVISFCCSCAFQKVFKFMLFSKSWCNSSSAAVSFFDRERHCKEYAELEEEEDEEDVEYLEISKRAQQMAAAHMMKQVPTRELGGARVHESKSPDDNPPVPPDAKYVSKQIMPALEQVRCEQRERGFYKRGADFFPCACVYMCMIRSVCFLPSLSTSISGKTRMREYVHSFFFVVFCLPSCSLRCVSSSRPSCVSIGQR